jgi:hypothetical protein
VENANGIVWVASRHPCLPVCPEGILVAGSGDGWENVKKGIRLPALVLRFLRGPWGQKLLGDLLVFIRGASRPGCVHDVDVPKRLGIGEHLKILGFANTLQYLRIFAGPF